MGLDIRLPIGALFAIIGVLLTGYGLASDRAIYRRSFGINVNLWWGLVLVAFGAWMLALARRARRRAADARPPATGRSR
jgi:hypothetical protein